ncbi:MAG: bifunctional metallophosphatase/5'-nucleotidase [Methylacidiphilales bacterium]|nr:bifunctional metallophosphatase/5'-nucleotidase [Candidatus Methylacidiphilales bacterium]
MNIHVPEFSRRRFLRALGHGALLAALPSALLAEEGDVVTISLLHTTDLHGHILPTFDYDGNPDLGGLARCVTQIRQWQQANPHSLLLDIGDVYQGTEVSLRTRGETMIRCFNALKYDAWVVGNHDFDWGFETLVSSVSHSSMPVLSGNAIVNFGLNLRPPSSSGTFSQPPAAFSNYLFREVAGFRIAIIGLTTPGLPTWLPPEDLGGFEVFDPIVALRNLLAEVSAQKPDAIVVTGHMGVTRRDDDANRVGALTREFPQLTVYIGGHTHKNYSGELVNGVLYTQADHYGIYAGKVDLTFDRTSRRLLRREAVTIQMDSQFALDPLVLSLAHADLDAADLVLKREIGELTEPFDIASAFAQPSDVERLIGSAMKASLRKHGIEVDAVVHGLFDHKNPLGPGSKTVADTWDILPYENDIVTIEVSRDDLLAIARDLGSGREYRSVMGVTVVGTSRGHWFQVDDLRAADGSPLPDKPSYRIAFNSYDSQSGGGRFTTVGRLVRDSANKRILYAIDTRDALIDFFVTRQKVGKASLLV